MLVEIEHNYIDVESIKALRVYNGPSRLVVEYLVGNQCNYLIIDTDQPRTLAMEIVTKCNITTIRTDDGNY